MKIPSILFASLLIAETLADEQLTPEKMVADIHQESLQDILWNLDQIGRRNGGNRAFGFPGYKASMDFVLEHVVDRFGDHFDTTVQPFNYTFSTTYNISVSGPDGDLEDVLTVENNNPTPSLDGVTGPLVALPINDDHGSGCFQDQWKDLDVHGKIALVKRGGCPMSQKLSIAKARGAVGALVFNNVSGSDIEPATLDDKNYGTLTPVALITLEQGLDWKKQLDTNKTIEVTLTVDAIVEDRETWQIISETKKGDSNSVVMAGAHLDSVQAGPGIDDDGSGTAALLEIASSITKYTGFKNKIRLAWWGAEESGMIGSSYYVSQLSEEDTDKIRFYFNFDMIASPRPFYHVYANDDDDKTGGHFLYDYLMEEGYPVEYAPFEDDSDYVSFIEAGIPAAGLFTGAGDPYDTCYHEPSDDIDNINWTAMTINTKAAAKAISELAISMDHIPPREETSANPSSKRSVARNLTKWKRIAKGLGKKHSCAGGKTQTV
ncbi:hypothetical protein ACHAPT_012897 [Fusarium lateritium]